MGCRSPSTDVSYLQAQLRASMSILLLSLAHCQSLDALSAPVAQVLEIYINAAILGQGNKAHKRVRGCDCYLNRRFRVVQMPNRRVRVV